jgi:hypothetical protein
MTDQQSPAEHAAEIAAARQRLIAFVLQCADGDWTDIQAALRPQRPPG